MERDELLECCYDWQAGNTKWESWVISLTDEYIGLDRGGRELKDKYQIKRTRCNDIQ